MAEATMLDLHLPHLTSRTRRIATELARLVLVVAPAMLMAAVALSTIQSTVEIVRSGDLADLIAEPEFPNVSPSAHTSGGR